MVLDLFKSRRRQKLYEEPLPGSWREIRRRRAPFTDRLTEEQRARLDGLMQIFLAEKTFEGCGGLEMTDEIRVTVAAHACLLLLNRRTDIYPLLQSILVYPASFRVESIAVDEAGVVSEEEQEMLGESWRTGALVLSWEDVLEDLEYPEEGYNVILHEFAHQLDDESGEADGAPPLETAEQIRRWHEVMDCQFRALQKDLDRDRPTLLDEYGAESPAEFFATATETFFLLSAEMKENHPELYELLAEFYRLDPAAWSAENG